MGDRGYRDARPFGRRRGPDALPAPGWDARPDADGSPEPPARTGVLAWALRTAAVAGFLGLFAAQYLVRVSGPGEPARVALAARGPQGDPETTGSIGRSAGGAARATRLDPCALEGGGRPRP